MLRSKLQTSVARTRNIVSSAKGPFALALLASALSANAADAEKEGFYLGAAGGVTQYRLKGGDFNTSAFATRSTKKRDNGGKLFAGYRFNENFAVEAQYGLLGEAKINIASPSGDLGRLKYESTAASVSGIGILPLSQDFSLFGKLGGGRVQVEVEPSSSSFGSKVKANQNTLLVGAGAMYAVTPAIDLRAEFEGYTRAGKRERGGRSSINQFTVGASYRF